MKVDVGVSDHNVDTQSRVEQKLGPALMIAPVPVGWRVSGRSRQLNDDGLARMLMNDGGLTRMRRPYNSVTTTECHERYRYQKKLRKTKHGRYPHTELGLSANPGPALIPPSNEPAFTYQPT